jgi:hypothetical protein
MPKIEPAGASTKISVLIHADIGWGKTSFIGTGGKDAKILIVRPPTDHVDPIVGSGCDEVVVRNWEEIFETLEWVQHEGQNYDWVWIDSISLLQDWGLDDLYENVLDRKGPVGSLARKDREQYGPDRGEYRVNFWRLAQYVRHIVGAGTVNLGITAHAFWWEPGDNDVTPSCLWPWIQGKMMPAKISGMVNIVAYGSIETREGRGGRKRTVRVLHTNATENWYAKCQFKLPDGTSPFGSSGEIVSPTLPGMMEEINKCRPSANGAGRRRRTRRET